MSTQESPASSDSLSSPEQMDQLIQVSSPAAWLLLVALGALVAVSLAWGLFGRIDTRVEGEGVLLGGSVRHLVARGAGQILRLHVGPGDRVTPGQVLAEIEQPDLERELTDAQTRLQAARDDFAKLESFSRREAELKADYLEKQRQTLERSIADAQERLDLLKQQMQSERELVDKGVLTQRDLLPTQDTFNATNSNLERSRAELTQLRSTELRDMFNAGKDLLTAERAIFEAERDVAKAEDDLTRQGRIISPYEGAVLEVLAEAGGLVTDSQAVIKIDLGHTDTRSLYALAFVAADQAKKIRAGMDAQIAPSTVLPEKDGYIRARVVRVSAFPATSEEMKLALKNDPLVSRLAKSGEPFEVEIELLGDPATPSGLAWTSGQGPDLEIGSGTLTKAYIVVERQRPIELVVPSAKGLLGSR